MLKVRRGMEGCSSNVREDGKGKHVEDDGRMEEEWKELFTLAESKEVISGF